MFKKLLVLPIVALLLVSSPRPVKAIIGTIDNVPAATMLVPYFEVDLNNPNGKTTLFSINNASATAVLAHVTLWSDLGVATFGFNVYLTGYDVSTINLRDIFVNGTLPLSASAGQDPSDQRSPKGSFSQDINFASCSGILPPPPMPAIYVQHLQLAHTGMQDTFTPGQCAGLKYFDGIARGYVTVDTVNSCTLSSPSDPNYFSSPATFQNVLWGDVFYVDPGQNFASGDATVQIESDLTNPETSAAGQYTFYGRYVNWLALDHREPLPTVSSARFLQGGAFSGGTDLVAWRDPKVNQTAFNCNNSNNTQKPGWFPLGQQEIVIFDEQEQPLLVQQFPFFPQPPPVSTVPFPAAVTKYHVGDSTMPVPFQFGWIRLNLNTTVPSAGSVPPEAPYLSQNWVTVTHSANGRYSVGYAATQLGNPALPGSNPNTCVNGC